jgi:hypothetical protein
MLFSPRIYTFIFLLSVLIASVGCGGGSMAPQAASAQPAITLQAQPTTVLSGASVVLSWKASNANSVNISGLGTFPATGSTKVTPTASTTYTATANGPQGTKTASAVVSVSGSASAVPTVALTAQPNSIAAGAISTLSWTTTNSTSVSIPGLGTYPPSGSVPVTPNATATYTATASGAGGTAASSATVTVSQSTSAPTITFSAQPSSVSVGSKSVLSWTTTNATSVNIPGLGSFPARGSTNVTPSTTTTYTATAQGASSATAQASTTVTVQTQGTPLAHLQASGGWQSWGEYPPGYGICSYPCPGISWSMKQGIKSPSLSGDASQFNIGGSKPYADVLWSNPLIGARSTQGLPDSGHTLLPTIHNFTYDAYFYPTNLGVTQVLEFDINMYFDGLSLIWGHQCNILGGHEWDIWDNVHQKWVSSGAACNPVNNAWNHLTIHAQRESDNSLLFQSITLNGVTSKINRTYPPGSSPGSWWGVTANFQMDGDVHQSAYTTFLDNFTLSYW